MAKVVKHASTHRPRAYGGTDPLWGELPMIMASSNGAGDQSVTATTELEFNVFSSYTNAPEIFRMDEDDPGGIYILDSGFYRFSTIVRVQSAFINVSRTIYQTGAALSSGPLAGIGSELGFSGSWSHGTGMGLSGPSIAGGTGGFSKSVLTHEAMSALAPGTTGSPPTLDPTRYAVILQHNGVNWDISSSAGDSVSIIVRLNSGLVLPMDDAPWPL